MIVKSLFASFMMMGALFGAPQRDSLAVQELKMSMDQISYNLNSHRVEIDLFHERLQNLETEISKLNGSVKLSSKSPQESRISALEKGQEALISDMKKLSSYLEETSSKLSSCQTKLSQIDKQLSSDIQSLKSSLHSMLALLKGEDPSGKTYVVKPGDSLGQIALDNKASLKAIKELNGIQNDVIYVGQKLRIP